MSTTPQPKILCVDDDQKNLRLLEALLAPRGYTIVMAASGEEALAMAAREMPDVILLDIMMPHMSGIEVLKRLRENRALRLIPVVMLTALREIEDRVASLDAGCDDFISKPFEKTELLARIQSLVKMNFYRRQLDEKQKFEAAIGTMVDGVAVLAPDWTIERTNRAAKEYLGITDEHANLKEHVCAHFSAPQLGVPETIAVEKSVSFDIVREEGAATRALYLEANASPVRDPEGMVTNIVLTLRDVSARRREESMKRDFLSFISHKLYTPLTVLQGFADMMKKETHGPLNDKQRDAMARIMQMILRLQGLFNRLIQFVTAGKPAAGKNIAPVDLVPFLRAKSEHLGDLYPERSVALSLALPEALPAVRFDKHELDLILDNLIDNAVKFNDNPQIRIELAAAHDAAANVVTLTIADNGRGIPPEEFGHIFDAFYQVEKYYTGQVEGVGMGLATLRRIVEREHGSIAVHSTLGQGTTFTCTLPCASRPA